MLHSLGGVLAAGREAGRRGKNKPNVLEISVRVQAWADEMNVNLQKTEADR